MRRKFNKRSLYVAGLVNKVPDIVALYFSECSCMGSTALVDQASVQTAKALGNSEGASFYRIVAQMRFSALKQQLYGQEKATKSFPCSCTLITLDVSCKTRKKHLSLTFVGKNMIEQKFQAPFFPICVLYS